MGGNSGCVKAVEGKFSGEDERGETQRSSYLTVPIFSVSQSEGSVNFLSEGRSGIQGWMKRVEGVTCLLQVMEENVD